MKKLTRQILKRKTEVVVINGTLGTDVMIFENTFAEKIWRKYWRFLLTLLLLFCIKLTEDLGPMS
jgi:hypothetical protein